MMRHKYMVYGFLAALGMGLLTAYAVSAASTPEVVHLENPLSTTNISTIVGKAINFAMGIMGSLALLVFVYGGFKWLTAAGNSDKVQEGTEAMTWAAIGIFIIFGSYAILNLIFKGIGVQQSAFGSSESKGCYTYCDSLNQPVTCNPTAFCLWSETENKCLNTKTTCSSFDGKKECDAKKAEGCFWVD